jgi:hypothetical protein
MVSVSSLHIGQVGSTSDWLNLLFSEDIICQLVIDCQKLVDTGLLPKIDDLIYDIETASKVLCHAIHTRRLNFNCAVILKSKSSINAIGDSYRSITSSDKKK